MRRLAVFLFAAGLAAQDLAVLPESAAPFREAVEQSRELILDWQRANHTPGLSAAVAVNGRVAWSEGFGWADLEQHVPAASHTRFRIGSVSKLFAAAALVKLAEQGRIDIDAPVQRYVADFPRKRWPVTARQLAAHMAGIRHYRDADFATDGLINQKRHFPTVLEGLAIFEDDPLEFEPGTKSSYSSYGFNLLSAVLAGAAGKPYLQLIHDLITEPLGLLGTGADHPYRLVPNRSRFYVYRQGETLNAPFLDSSYKWAGGGYLSTSEDLVRFAFAFIYPGFLSESSLRLMLTTQTTAAGEDVGVGIGWRVDRDDQGRRRFHHGGTIAGGGAILLALPDDEVAVAIVANQLPRPTNKMAARIAVSFADARPLSPGP